jgi:hypothetical protein
MCRAGAPTERVCEDPASGVLRSASPYILCYSQVLLCSASMMQ